MCLNLHCTCFQLFWLNNTVWSLWKHCRKLIIETCVISLKFSLLASLPKWQQPRRRGHTEHLSKVWYQLPGYRHASNTRVGLPRQLKHLDLTMTHGVKSLIFVVVKYSHQYHSMNFKILQKNNQFIE